MKKLMYLLLEVFVFSGCAIHQGYMLPSASLSEPNFVYVKQGISGTSTVTYFLGLIGGLSRQAIVEEAKRDMISKYPLERNQALVNVTVNWKINWVHWLIFPQETCTVSADVVEFYNDISDIGKNVEQELKKDNQKNSSKKSDKYHSSGNELMVGDKVQYKDLFKNITGEIIKINNGYYYIKYVNKNGNEKIFRAYDKKFITKIK